MWRCSSEQSSIFSPLFVVGDKHIIRTVLCWGLFKESSQSAASDVLHSNEPEQPQRKTVFIVVTSQLGEAMFFCVAQWWSKYWILFVSQIFLQ